MKRLRHISLVILALLAIGLPSALGQQLQAPRGGITIVIRGKGGKVYKGGQYLPSRVIIGPYAYSRRQPFVSFGYTRMSLSVRANSTRLERINLRGAGRYRLK